MKQSTLFPTEEVPVVPELDLKEAARIADQVKTCVAIHCSQIEVAGSIRRQREKVHDIDFVVVAKSDAEWQKINEELKRLKAKPSCQGNAVIKAYVPCQAGLFQVDFYRAKPETFGIHLLVRTGSADHNMWLAAHVYSRGMRLKYSQGLLKDEVAVAGADEAGVFAALDLPCPEPSAREIVDGNPTWQKQAAKETG